MTEAAGMGFAIGMLDVDLAKTVVREDAHAVGVGCNHTVFREGGHAFMRAPSR